MGTSFAMGEFSKMWDFDEEVFITAEEKEEEAEVKKDK